MGTSGICTLYVNLVCVEKSKRLCPIVNIARYVFPAMRIIARRTLRKFTKHPDTETPLKVWFKEVQMAQWTSFNRLKYQFSNVSIIGIDRVVFNIKGNSY